jgi:hypothetical protein
MTCVALSLETSQHQKDENAREQRNSYGTLSITVPFIRRPPYTDRGFHISAVEHNPHEPTPQKRLAMPVAQHGMPSPTPGSD